MEMQLCRIVYIFCGKSRPRVYRRADGRAGVGGTRVGFSIHLSLVGVIN
jgi:hypothetical protein